MFRCANSLHTAIARWKDCGFVSAGKLGNVTSRTCLLGLPRVPHLAQTGTCSTQCRQSRRCLLDVVSFSEFTGRDNCSLGSTDESLPLC